MSYTYKKAKAVVKNNQITWTINDELHVEELNVKLEDGLYSVIYIVINETPRIAWINKVGE